MRPSQAHLRCGDADRDRAAEGLRRHYGEGRLSAEEFSDRMDAAYAARTFGDLDALTADLPPLDVPRAPEPAPRHQLDRWHVSGPVVAVVALAVILIAVASAIPTHGHDAPFIWPLWLVFFFGLRFARRRGR